MEASKLNIPSVTDFDLVTLDNQSMITEAIANEQVSQSLNLGKYGSIEIDLVVHDIMSDQYEARTQDGLINRRSTAITLNGFTNEGGEVRLTLDDNFTYGYIETADERYYIEPAWYYEEEKVKSDKVVIYRESDVHAHHHRACGVSESQLNAAELRSRARKAKSRASRLGQCYEVELAIASDYSMFVKYNSSTTDVENHNIAVINNVIGDYTGAFDDDIEFTIVTQWFSTCNSCDPWTNDTDAGVLLQSFTIWGQGGGFMTNYDLGELWTNRDFDGPTIGIAWVGEVCTNLRYHCLQDFSSNANLLRVVASHEIGHNFDAIHAPSNGFIMSATVSNTMDWHSNSVNDISDYIDFIAGQGGCFSPCPAGDAPIPAFEVLADNICPGQTIKFFDRSANNPTQWQWSFPGGNPSASASQHPTVTYDVPGTYSVFLEVANGAGTNSQTFSNVINVGDPGLSFPLYQDFDNGFQDWAVDNPDNSVTWELATPTAAPGGNMTAYINNFAYPNTGRRDALVSPEFSLAGYQLATLHVEYAHAAFTSGPRDSLIIAVSGDGGQSFQRFFANSENGTGNFATALPTGNSFNPQSLTDWCGLGGFGATCIDVDISNFLGSRNVIVRIENFTNSGNNTYIDRVYVTTNCFNLPPPIADFSAQPLEGCVPLVVQFTDQSQNSPIEWLWQFDGGSPATSTDQHPEVIYSTPGEYAVTLTVENESGIDVSVQTAYIHAIGDPVALFSSSVTGDVVTFTNMSIDANTYLWDFGDGFESMDEHPVHQYGADGSYDVVLQVFNDCGMSEFSQTIMIGTPPTASYDHSGLSGCVPDTIQFVSTSSANTTDYQWFFEGGEPASSTVSNPQVVYENPGTFDVTLIAINGSGSDTLLDENVVIMESPPMAAFSFAVMDRTVNFLNESDGADGYTWFFGDGNMSMDENPEHEYATDGSYNVILVASNNCGDDTITAAVGVGGFPSSDFTLDVMEGCAPLQVVFEAVGAGVNDNVFWAFEGGNPATSTSRNVTVSYAIPGSYDVQLIVSNSLGSDTTFRTNVVTVQGPPDGSFTYTGDGFLTYDFIYFGDAYDEIIWFFGDGNSSNQDAPTHQYEIDISSGIDVSCIVRNACGADTLVLTIDEGPLYGLTLPASPVCMDNEIQFELETFTDFVQVEWVFEGGTPATSNVQNPLIEYVGSGVFDVQLTLTKNGAPITLLWQDTVIIETYPIADFTPIDNVMENFSQHATSFEWYVDGTLEGTTEDLVLASEGEFEIMLIAANSCGADSLTQNVSVSSTANVPLRINEMKVLPNPNNGTFALDFGKLLDKVDLSILSMDGRLLMENPVRDANGYSYHIGNLAEGIYMLMAKTDDEVYLTKMVVVR